MPTAETLNLKPGDIVFLANQKFNPKPAVPGGFEGDGLDFSNGTKAKVIEVTPGDATLVQKLESPGVVAPNTVDPWTDKEVGYRAWVWGGYHGFTKVPLDSYHV